MHLHTNPKKHIVTFIIKLNDFTLHIQKFLKKYHQLTSGFSWQFLQSAAILREKNYAIELLTNMHFY